MKVVAISGSKRKGGNCDFVLDMVGQIITGRGSSFQTICLRDKKIAACGSCGDCNFRGSPCQLEDDMPDIIRQLVNADALIYIAPVHAFGMAHLMQIFLERAGVCFLRFKRPLRNRFGIPIVVGRRYSHSAVYSQFVSNMLLNRMIIVGSGYPNTLNSSEKGSVMEDKEGLSAIYASIERMFELDDLLRNPQNPSLRSALSINEREQAAVFQGVVPNAK
jgi:multimeric flavodoxin WrbA